MGQVLGTQQRLHAACPGGAYVPVGGTKQTCKQTNEAHLDGEGGMTGNVQVGREGSGCHTQGQPRPP